MAKKCKKGGYMNNLNEWQNINQQISKMIKGLSVSKKSNLLP